MIFSTLNIILVIYSLGVSINVIIDLYYDLFTNREFEKRNVKTLNLLYSWFSTRKILNENKKYSFCPKSTKISIISILSIIIIFSLFYLNEKGVIDINFIITPLKQFDNWINDIFQKLFVNPISSLLVSIFERFWFFQNLFLLLNFKI